MPVRLYVYYLIKQTAETIAVKSARNLSRQYYN